MYFGNQLRNDHKQQLSMISFSCPYTHQHIDRQGQCF